MSKKNNRFQKSKKASLIHDWLEDERPQTGTSRQRRGNKSVAKWLDEAETNAVVIEVFPGMCQVRLDGTKENLLCRYRRNTVLVPKDHPYLERSPVTVGDRVHVQKIGSSDGLVTGLTRRRNVFRRFAPGREGAVHNMASNLDQIVILSSYSSPDYSPGLVERMKEACRLGPIPFLLVVNKIDLRNGTDEPWNGQVTPQDLRLVSVLSGEGIKALRTELRGKRVAFCGHSGVGKTSVIRALLEEDVGRVAEVNHATQKGKHTTTSSRMYVFDDDSFWIDTPGVKEFEAVPSE